VTGFRWKEHGVAKFYLSSEICTKSQEACNYGKRYIEFPGESQFIRGKWHLLQQYIKLNQPKKCDGVLLAWMDSKLICSCEGIDFVGEDYGIGGICLSIFYSSPNKQDTRQMPNKETCLYFKKFTVFGNKQCL